MIQFWYFNIVQKQLVNNLPPFKRSPSFLPRHQHSPVVAIFFYCICSTWNDHLFSIVYDPPGMMESPPFPIVYKIHVKWLPFAIVYDPRGMTTFSHSICSTWNLYEIKLLVVDYFVVFLSSPGAYSDAVRACPGSFFVISSVVGTVLCMLQQWRIAK